MYLKNNLYCPMIQHVVLHTHLGWLFEIYVLTDYFVYFIYQLLSIYKVFKISQKISNGRFIHFLLNLYCFVLYALMNLALSYLLLIQTFKNVMWSLFLISYFCLKISFLLLISLDKCYFYLYLSGVFFPYFIF